nr:multidrug efflux SMR transporter [Paraprevotella clara]
MIKSYTFLICAILAEALGTTTLKLSEQFTKPVPAIVTVLAYATAFCLLSLSLKTIPVGIAYAIWAAVGIVLIAIIGVIAFKQTPDLPALIGLVLIIAGVIIINVFSKMSVH